MTRTTADGMTLNEARGTGTALGDPIEAGSLVIAVLSSRSDEIAPLALGGVKRTLGAEPAAGMTGMLKLSGLEERCGTKCSNACAEPDGEWCIPRLELRLAAQQLDRVMAHAQGVSAHLATAVPSRMQCFAARQMYRRQRYGAAAPWLQAPRFHVVRCSARVRTALMPTESDGDGAITFRSPTMGVLHDQYTTTSCSVASSSCCRMPRDG